MVLQALVVRPSLGRGAARHCPRGAPPLCVEFGYPDPFHFKKGAPDTNEEVAWHYRAFHDRVAAEYPQCRT